MAALVLTTAMLAAPPLLAQSRDLGGGFIDHGPFADAIMSRGIVCTVDGEGRDVVLVWLFDHREGYALAVIDAQTGAVEEIPRPVHRNSPFASILSSQGRYYTYFAGHFMEFDPRRRAFSFVKQGPWRDAFSMTEDDRGGIWAAIYPGADVVSYDPANGEFREWGPISEHASKQMPRSIAADDLGWIYVGIGLVVGQVFMLDSATAEVREVLRAGEIAGGGEVELFRAVDGAVYGFAPTVETDRQWFALRGGEVTRLDAPPDVERQPIIAGDQRLRHLDLPGGGRVRRIDLAQRLLVIEEAEAGATRELEFEISGGGADAMGLAATSCGLIVGGTYHPMRSFSYDPREDQWVRRESFGQWNVLASARGRVYMGGYGGGDLLEWDPAAEWVTTRLDDPTTNPRVLLRALPLIGRPCTMLAHPDGRHLLYGGRPGYGYTGGALVIYDLDARSARVIPDEELVPDQSPASLAALPDGRVAGGATIIPGNGGVQKAEVAELFIIDARTGAVEWRGAPLADVARYDDLVAGDDGMVFGIADRTLLFGFDTERREIVRVLDLGPEFGRTVHQQGPRIFVETPGGRVFVLLTGGIAELDRRTGDLTMAARAPEGVELGNGGAYLDGCLYFAGGVRLLSWAVPVPD